MDRNITILQNEIMKLVAEDKYSTKEISEIVNCSTRHVRHTKSEFGYLLNIPEQKEFENHVDTVSRQKQKLQDKLRVERSKFRIESRNQNAIEELLEEISATLQSEHSKFNTVKHEIGLDAPITGIMQVSDIHFNEIVDLPFNQFDFTIAAKRLKKYVIKATRIFKAHGIKKVLIAFTGDMMNSDRRLDEIMTMATNRARASVLSAMILKQLIIDMNKNFNIKISCVTGNESRMNKEMGSSEIMQTDNYDLIIHEMLRMMFDGKAGIEFIDGSFIELPLEVEGHNILFIHGHQVKMSQVSSQMQRLKGKWSDYGKSIDYIIFGHFHTSRITDLFARSGGVCGANAYSDNQLQLSSRASQNIFLVDREGIDGIKIDLQHYSGIDGYEVAKDLEAYNAKAAKQVKWLNPKKI